MVGRIDGWRAGGREIWDKLTKGLKDIRKKQEVDGFITGS